MKTQYRLIFTATFDSAAERDKAYAALKSKVTALSDAAAFVEAKMTKDENIINEPSVTERVI
jgi:hypothetical protein